MVERQTPLAGQRAVFAFGTKAETLQRLQALLQHARVPDFLFFSLKEWNVSRDAVVARVLEKFTGATLAVRSSALIEDGARHSMAGAFLSLLDVDGSSPEAVADAIDRVAHSMTGDPRDQVLVQPMISDVAVNGVIMTYDMVHGTPYYCIDFDDESGRTDTVTGGSAINKGLFVYRDAAPEYLRSSRVARFLELARELETLCQCAALDIEFGLSREGQLYLFQVRRMSMAGQWHPVTERRVERQLAFVEEFVRDCSLPQAGIVGDTTVLAVMPDWNPAELIGTTPRPLSASLYREMITRSTWHEARAVMGYRRLHDAELMVQINGHPYIDVRLSFNSFLPADVSDDIGAKLVNAWLTRLKENPEFHDKVEFDVVPTCLDFCFDEDFTERYPSVLDTAELQQFRSALQALTRQAITPGPASTLTQALDTAERLARSGTPTLRDPSARIALASASRLLSTCRQQGVLPFAISARHAFIAESLMRSAVRRGALTSTRLEAFKRSIHTVTANIVREYAQVCLGTLSREEFLSRFGHLRPGTYEITSLRYDERDDLFLNEVPTLHEVNVHEFQLDEQERAALNALLQESGLDVLDADQLLTYARTAIAARESVKFTFTKVLSDALSLLISWGEQVGLSRDDLAYLEWNSIQNCLTQPPMDYLDRHYQVVAANARLQLESAHAFKLAHIIAGVPDIYVATLNRSVPNFVGTGVASGTIVEVTAKMSAQADIEGRIICIENADPGFDWIFTQRPAALITRFGGANSHMAIRCAEFGLPAAIGCGDQLYSRLVAAGTAELNCAEKILRALHEK
ncbi:pyruvate, phosphate dikinase [Achromobacter sp. B7]|uniref:PEP/pyruvate-binding domain-containing protein n=1 Tax=Achromobacter sp. B7 TaxID=2282475 RepID=UPI000E73B0CD|nr:PEP/pyruvate-binding domain-containing protein [Achromobacter sp. B7]AYD67203.1 pyruvate, phosphate dikinase [Achromobacter sp. B7]